MNEAYWKAPTFIFISRGLPDNGLELAWRYDITPMLFRSRSQMIVMHNFVVTDKGRSHCVTLITENRIGPVKFIVGLAKGKENVVLTFTTNFLFQTD